MKLFYAAVLWWSVAFCLLPRTSGQFGFGDVPMDESQFPPVQIGVIERPSSCEARVTANCYAVVDVKVYIDDGMKGWAKKTPVIDLKDKLIHGVRQFNFIPGVEMGIVGACVKETRSLRIPSVLGFAILGSRRYSIPPKANLRAIVQIKDVYNPSPAEVEADEFFIDVDLEELDDGEDADDTQFDSEDEFMEQGTFEGSAVIEATDATLESVVEGKNALIEFYAPWCGACNVFRPEYIRAATALASQEDVVVVAVDATENEVSASAYGVDGYPTVALRLGESGKVVLYDGPRRKEDVIRFVRKEIEAHAARAETTEDVDL